MAEIRTSLRPYGLRRPATTKVTPEGLCAKVRSYVGRNIRQKVYIRADARTKYSSVVKALDCVRAAGVEKIVFLVGERPVPFTHNSGWQVPPY